MSVQKSKTGKVDFNVIVKNCVSDEEKTVAVIVGDSESELCKKIGDEFGLKPETFDIRHEGEDLKEGALAPGIELEIIAKIPCKIRNGTDSDVKVSNSNIKPGEEILLFGRDSEIFLETRDVEFEWGGRSRPIVGGQTYVVVNKSPCQELSDEDVKKAGCVIRQAVEGHLDFKTPMLNDINNHLQLRKRVAEVVGKDHKTPSIVSSVWGYVVDNGEADESWLIPMGNHPNQPVVNNSLKNDQSLEKIKENDVEVHVYYRALDRHPGGNSDNHVVRHVIDLQNETNTCTWFVDGDGTPYLHKGVDDHGESFGEDVLPKIRKLLKTTKQNSWLFESTIIDEACDSDEYETEWSSIDILVYAKPVSPSSLITRIHQYSLCPNIHTVTESDKTKGTPAEISIFESTTECLEMEQPEDIDDRMPAGIKQLSEIGGFFPFIFSCEQ